MKENAEKSLINQNKPIFLVGFMGAGKSSVSKEIAKLTGGLAIELDDLIIESEQMPITQIFAQKGEAYFRELETKMLREINCKNNTTISCGGGIVLKDENIKIMREKGVVVWLCASPETILDRVRDSTDRPILNGNMNVEFIAELLEKRLERYKLAADFTVNTDDLTIREVAGELTGVER